ncbi:MAG: hypothetical protein ABEJ60_04160 [Halodesulfurarchaeum sp.]
MMSEDATNGDTAPEDEQDSAAKTMATELFRHEQAIREILDPLVVKKLSGERGEIRERLREFGDQNPTIFQGLVLTSRGVEEFFDDVREESVPGGTLETLEDFRTTYGPLSDEFGLVWTEKRLGARNPNPRVSTSRNYNSDAELPLMECEVKSEGITLGEFRVPPSHALTLAETLLAHAGYVVRDTIQSGESIDPDETDQLFEELETLTSTAAETREYVKAIESEGTVSEGDDDEVTGDDGPAVDGSTDYFY